MTMIFKNNRFIEVKEAFIREIAQLYIHEEALFLFRLFFEEVSGYDYSSFQMQREARLSESVLRDLIYVVDDLKTGRPWQYITGYTEFCGMKIMVEPAVLIPRPETEELVLKVVDKISTIQPLDGTAGPGFSMLDACTGSGAIALALKSFFPQAAVYAFDKHEAALAVAERNALKLKLDVVFRMADILEPPSDWPAVDLLISNPPYVRDAERAQMHPNVLQHEPPSALFVPDNDPLLYYRALADWALQLLKPGGCLAVEINEALAADTSNLLSSFGFTDMCVEKDFRGKDRFVFAYQ